MNKLDIKEEEIDGFIVTEKLKKIWNVQIELIKEFQRICKKYDIKYFAHYGTMLGIVRHKGFIPWDDDADFGMTRENFEKLISHADEFKKPFFLQHALNDRRFFLDYARLRNSNTTGIITWNNDINYNNGIYIDIYVLDGLTNSDFKLKMQIFKRGILRTIIKSYYLENMKKDNKGFKKAIMHIMHLISKFKSYENWIKVYNKNLSKYNKNSKNLTILTHEIKDAKKCIAKEDLDSMVNMPFENIEVSIPKNYDRILTTLYGEYMKFPPKEQLGKWHETSITFDPDISYIEFMEKKNESSN